MERKFYGGNGRNERDYGHNRNVKPSIEFETATPLRSLAVIAFLALAAWGAVGALAYVVFS